MKKNIYSNLILLMAMLFSISTFAQNRLQPSPKEMGSAKGNIEMKTGLEVEENLMKTGPSTNQWAAPVASETSAEVNLGMTRYDLQTNASTCNRFTRTADGKMYGTWTMGEEDLSGYPDRGTGYNSFDGSDWGNVPTARLEETARTGWPNYVLTEDGTEFVVNHVFDAGAYRLHYLRREAGATDWTEGDLPTSTPVGSLWPRATVGGMNGNSIHVISITTPTGDLGGVLYEGVDMHVIYHRSTDAGATWDIVDGIIPGLDSTLMKDLIRADAYSIDAKDDVVAIGLFSLFNDVKVFKSTNNGDNWDNWTVKDFPIDQYVIDQGYTVDDLPPFDSLNSPAELAIHSTDGAGAVIIDNNDMVHTFYSEMYVIDDDTTDAGGWSFYPCTSGIAYWNEGFGEDSIRSITGLLDLNGNGINDLDCAGGFNFGRYGVAGLTSFPSAAIDDQNNIYLSYQMVMESPDYISVLDDQHHTHIWMMASQDGGDTWSDPYNVINAVVLDDDELEFFTEGVFGHLARRADDHVHLIYQQDFSPGISVLGDMDPASTNLINYVAVSLDEFGIMTSTEEVEDISINHFSIQPNPASDQVRLYYDLPKAGTTNLTVLNTFGQTVLSKNNISGYHGLNDATLNVSNLSTGIYFLQLEFGEMKATQKLIVK